MRVAAMYDIHGNLPALEAVLAAIEAEQPDFIVIGGDVAAGPLPRPTIERLLALGDRVRFVRGNADRLMVAASDGASFAPHVPPAAQQTDTWAAQQIDRAHRDLLASFAPHVTLPIDGIGDVLFCHATPRSDEETLTVRSSDARWQEALAGVEQRVVVCGHTHMQFDRMIGDMRVVNAGSVGMPYGAPGVYWLMLGPDITLRHTVYDLAAAASRIRASGYPLADDFAANNVLVPPSEAEALAVFDPE